MGGAATKVAPNPDGGVEVRTPDTLQWQDPTRIFKEVDVDSNQSISSDELKSALQKQGYDDVVFATLMGELDVDSDGCIAFDEWRKGFYASSFVHVRAPAAEDFADLHMRTYGGGAAAPYPHGTVQWGGCTIAETAKRAITVAQLERVYSHIDRRCKPEGWADKSGNQRTPGTVTLYDAARFVIKPATYVKQCSFVELIAFGEQVPLYFVSHWWGESVLDFVKCLKQHAVDRVLGVDSPYWVCAYANNQWKLDDEIGGSLEESSFRKAMKLSFGTVTVLDEGGITFSRIWCGYEIFTSLAGDSHKTYDVYTCPKQGGAVGLVEGLSAGDKDAGAKQKRESAFPLERVRLDIQLQSAQASVEADRKAILNAIVGAAADAEPPKEHASYTRLNNMLAGRFAAGMVRTVIARGKKLDPYFAAIKASAATSLVIDLSNLIKCTDKELKLLTAALPNSLESLNLQLKGSKATEEGVTALFKHVCNLPRMRRLESDALASTHMPLVMKMAMLEEFPARGRLFPCAMALINAAAKCAATLKFLDVSLDSRFRDGAPAGPAGAAALALGLAANSALTKLSLASTFLGEEGTKAICEALKQNKTLKELDMSGCDNIGRAAGAKHVADMLGVNGALTEVNLDGFALPVKKLQGTDPVETLDLSGKKLGVASAVVIASLICANGGLMSLDLSHNDLCNTFGGTYTAEGITAIADALGALTSVDLRGNWLGDEGWGAIFAAICGNKDSKIISMDVSGENIGPAGVKLIAEALRTSVTGALTSVELKGNKLGDEGWGAIFAAICGNKDSKIMSMDVSGENIGPAGVKLIAEALRTSVTGALMKVNLDGVNLDGFALPVKKLKGTDPVETLDLSVKKLGVASAVVIAFLIGVNGGLTSIDLSGNELCGIWTDGYSKQQGTYTAEGITAIADALRVNGGLTSLNLSYNQLCGLDRDGRGTYTAEGITAIADTLRVNGSLTSVMIRGNKLGDEGWGAIFAAICGNKDSKIMSMDASSENIGPAGVKLIAEALRTSVTGGLTVANLMRNHLDVESAKMLAEVAKQKGISLCGIRHDQTTADFSGKFLKLPDAILLASDLSQAVVTGALTKIDLSGNRLGAEGAAALAPALAANGALTKLSLAWNKLEEEGTKAICEALKQNKTLKELDLSGHNNIGGEAGAKHVADMLHVNGGLKELNIAGNSIKDEGITAICNAVQGNKEGKLAKLNVAGNNMSPVGATAVAAMVAVTGALTVTNLLQNNLDVESAKMLAEVAKQKGISLCGIQRDQTTADFSNQDLKPPDAILLASDLSQAGVTGGLTSIDLSKNRLCGIWESRDGQQGTYTAEGITAIADALRVNGALTRVDVRSNNIAGDGAEQLAAAVLGNLKIEMFNKIPIKEMRADSFTELDLKGKGVGVEGVMVVAGLIPAMSALTKVNLDGFALPVKKLKGTDPVEMLDLSGKKLGGASAVVIASLISVNGGLTALDMSFNDMGEEGKALIRFAAQGKAGFNLHL